MVEKEPLGKERCERGSTGGKYESVSQKSNGWGGFKKELFLVCHNHKFTCLWRLKVNGGARKFGGGESTNLLVEQASVL